MSDSKKKNPMQKTYINWKVIALNDIIIFHIFYFDLSIINILSFSAWER